MDSSEEKILNALCDLVSLQRQSLDRLTERVESTAIQHSERTDRMEDKLSEAMSRLVSVVERISIVAVQNSEAINRLEQSIDRQNATIASFQTVTSQLVALAQQQAAIAQQQQATVDRLLAKN